MQRDRWSMRAKNKEAGREDPPLRQADVLKETREKQSGSASTTKARARETEHGECARRGDDFELIRDGQ